MTSLFAERALLPDGWHSAVRIEIAEGRIGAVLSDAAPAPADERHAVLVPAPGNVHSHAFQHAMAGLTERRGAGDDSFWTWRETMYRFALGMRPEDVEAVAAMLYVRMLEAGFGRVGEFHYLHHDRDGSAYADIGEMAARIAAASASTGIGLTLLPVFYAHAGFGPAPALAEQRRFVSSLDTFARLMERSGEIVAQQSGAVLGIAPHSLRAATLAEIGTILPLVGAGPVHIHVAEQTAEVEACERRHGARPVRLLLDNAPVDERWCLIHATHMTEDEIRDMASRGAVAGLCPITEANLGDGIFAGTAFRAAGGRFAVGSDSNVSISLAGELRQYEYSQRLGLRIRNAIADANGSTGRALFSDALAGGARALANPAGIAPGNRADLVALDGRAAPQLRDDSLLDGWIFGDDIRVDCVWAMGSKQVADGRHRRRDAIEARYRATMARLSEG